tara:strand:- start:250 stop:1479 length:1230 start_codon:yes stop_codon:yes gene_type:complete
LKDSSCLILKFLLLGLIGLYALIGTDNTIADNQELDIRGNVAFQLRGFTQDALWADQNSSDVESSISGEWEVRWRSEDNSQRVSFIPFARWDENDDKRSHFDLKEAYWAYKNGEIELLFGVNRIFWGVTESVHLVDVINQTDLVEDLDQEDKLGQPMISLALQKDWGLLSFYLLPYFRERSFPGVNGRLRAASPVDADNAKYESGNKRKHLDFALRYSHYFGDIDLGLHYFNGTNRDPRLGVGANNSDVVLNYDQMEQIGLDLQYTRGSWLWKLESFVRDGYEESFFASIAGFEYTFYQVFEGAGDVGVLLEYQYDNRSSYEAATSADNDVFIGARWVLNNMQDGSILAGVVVDNKTSEAFYSIEAESRLKEDVVLELQVRLIAHSEPGESFHPFSRDNYIQLQINRFF